MSGVNPSGSKPPTISSHIRASTDTDTVFEPLSEDLDPRIGGDLLSRIFHEQFPADDFHNHLRDIINNVRLTSIDDFTAMYNLKSKSKPMSVSECSLVLSNIYNNTDDSEIKERLKPVIKSRNDQLDRFSFKCLYGASIIFSSILYIVTFGQYSLKSRIDGWTQELRSYNKISGLDYKPVKTRDDAWDGWPTDYNRSGYRSDVVDWGWSGWLGQNVFQTVYPQSIVNNDEFRTNIDNMSNLRFTKYENNNCWFSTANLVLLNDKDTFKIHYTNAHDKYVRLRHMSTTHELQLHEKNQLAYLSAFLDFYSAITKPSAIEGEVTQKGQKLREAMTPFCCSRTMLEQMEGANTLQRQHIMKTAQTGVYEMLPDMLRGIYPDVTITIPPEQHGDHYNPEKTACEFVLGIENIARDEIGLYVLGEPKQYVKDTDGQHINRYDDLLELTYRANQNTQIHIGEKVQNVYRNADSVLGRSYIEYNLMSALKSFLPHPNMDSIDVLSQELYTLTTSVSVETGVYRALSGDSVENGKRANVADTMQLNLDKKVYNRLENPNGKTQITSIQESIAFTQDGFEPIFDGLPPKVREHCSRYLTQQQVCVPYSIFKKDLNDIFKKVNFASSDPGTRFVRFKQPNDTFKYYKLSGMCLKSGEGTCGHWTFLKISSKAGGTDEYRFYNNMVGDQHGVVKSEGDISDILKKNMYSGLELVYTQVETPSEELVRELTYIDDRVSSNQLNQGESMVTFLSSIVKPEAERQAELDLQRRLERTTQSDKSKKKKTPTPSGIGKKQQEKTTNIDFNKATANWFKSKNLQKIIDSEPLRYQAPAAKKRINTFITELSGQLGYAEGEGIRSLHELMTNESKRKSFLVKLKEKLPAKHTFVQIFESVENMYFKEGFKVDSMNNLLFAGRLLFIAGTEITRFSELGQKNFLDKLGELIKNADKNFDVLLNALRTSKVSK
jgi:hypothetical protein